MLVSMTADLLAEDPAVRDVRVEIEGSAPLIMADQEMLKIVFVNLLVNAAHAMEGRGVIRVSVAPAGDLCELTFRDAGPGIPPDIRDKIFAPIFTTKSRGTGLGLSTAKRLIEAHAGRISIECPPAGGTTITVALPIRQTASANISMPLNT
jgi:signal transduction histidine kinase